MPQTKRKQSRGKGRRGIILLLILILLALTAAAGVALRMLGWRGQQVQGTLTALVNPWNSVDSAGYKPTLIKVREVQVDQSCAEPLEQMLSDCEKAGCAPFLALGYISRGELEKNSALSTENETPGFSEHELGLAVDIRDKDEANAAASKTAAWLRENAWQYGFILRYPEGAEEITGLEPNAWHFRYVGEAAASQIQQLNITLEEYTTMFFNESAAVVFE